MPDDRLHKNTFLADWIRYTDSWYVREREIREEFEIEYCFDGMLILDSNSFEKKADVLWNRK